MYPFCFLYPGYKDTEYRKRGIDPFKAASVRGYFKEEEGFIAVSMKKKIGGFVRNYIVLDYEQCSEEIRDLIGEKDAIND